MLIKSSSNSKDRERYISFDHVVVFDIYRATYSKEYDHLQLLAHLDACAHPKQSVVIYEASIHSSQWAGYQNEADYDCAVLLARDECEAVLDKILYCYAENYRICDLNRLDDIEVK